MSVSESDRGAAIDVPGPIANEPATSARETIDLRTLSGLAAWTRTTQGDPAFRAVCATADVAPEAFSNGGGLVQVARLARWLAALRDRLGGDGALVAAGMASESSPTQPPAWLRWIATPGVLYRGRVAREWLEGGVGRIAVRRRSLGAAVVRYTAPEPQSRAVCLWRQARLAQRPRAWGLPTAIVHETRCLARGDGSCDYVVRWQARPRWTGAIAVAAATSVGLAWLGVAPGVAWIVPALGASLVHAIEVERVTRANRATDEAFAVAFRRATAPPPPTEPAVAEPPALAPEVDEPEAGPASVRREGDFWHVHFASKTVLIRHSRGLSLLVHLLRNPDQEIHVSALDALIPSEAAMPVASSAPVDATIGDLGDAGEVLDEQAKATYRHRLGELREELEDAEACNDLGRVERHRAELEALTDQLRQATGLGGRSRRASSNADRVRVAVTRRIRAAITQIEKHHPPLAEHLAATIHTGYFCSYGPGGVPWET